MDVGIVKRNIFMNGAAKDSFLKNQETNGLIWY